MDTPYDFMDIKRHCYDTFFLIQVHKNHKNLFITYKYSYFDEYCKYILLRLNFLEPSAQGPRLTPC